MYSSCAADLQGRLPAEGQVAGGDFRHGRSQQAEVEADAEELHETKQRPIEKGAVDRTAGAENIQGIDEPGPLVGVETLQQWFVQKGGKPAQHAAQQQRIKRRRRHCREKGAEQAGGKYQAGQQQLGSNEKKEKVKDVYRCCPGIGEKGQTGNQTNDQTLDYRQAFGEAQGVAEKGAGAFLRRTGEFAIDPGGKPEAQEVTAGGSGLVDQPLAVADKDISIAPVQVGFIPILVQVAEIFEINNVLIIP